MKILKYLFNIILICILVYTIFYHIFIILFDIFSSDPAVDIFTIFYKVYLPNLTAICSCFYISLMLIKKLNPANSKKPMK
jgi:hypothetical protein